MGCVRIELSVGRFWLQTIGNFTETQGKSDASDVTKAGRVGELLAWIV